MKNILLLSVLIFFHCKISFAQTKSESVRILFQEIQKQYESTSNYIFGFGLKAPAESPMNNGGTSLAFNKMDSCEGLCLCNSAILYKDPNQPSVLGFAISNVLSIKYSEEEKSILLETMDDVIVLTHPDNKKLELIYNDLQKIYKWCHI